MRRFRSQNLAERSLGLRPGAQTQVRDAGLSLVELLVVLAIIALVLAFALPNFRGPNRGVELKAIAQDLTSRLRATHALAIGRGQPLTVDFDLIGHRYGVEAQGRPVALPADVVIEVTTARELTQGAGHAKLQFFPDGSATGGQVMLRRKSLAYAVVIDWLTGFVHLEARS